MAYKQLFVFLCEENIVMKLKIIEKIVDQS